MSTSPLVRSWLAILFKSPLLLGASLGLVVPTLLVAGAQVEGLVQETGSGASEKRTADILLDLDHLPVAFLREAASDLTIRSHSARGLAMAYYQLVPVPDSQASAEESDPTGSERVEKVLFLRQDVYFNQGEGHELREVAVLPLDAVEYLMHSLILAHIERRVSQTIETSDLVTWLNQGGKDLLPDVDEQVAREYFVTAIAAFASHQLALRNEIERSYRRRAGDSAAQTRFCSGIQKGIGLFSTWRESFGPMKFTGYTDLPEGVERPSIRAEDKRQVQTLLFNTDWRGDALQDLGPIYCQQQENSAP